MQRGVLVFLFCVLIVASRRPDVLFHAQFWAEDGKFWYADAYNLGALAPFLHPAAGYFQTLPRLAALMAVALPLPLAPLALNCIAIVIQVLPACFLVSSRCRNLGTSAGRALFAFLYLALPNSKEMHANITNAQWILAFLALLIIFAEPPKTVLWNAFDLGILLLSALTGPFIIFIAPIALIFYWMEPPSRRRASLVGVSAAGAAMQLASVLIAGGAERMSQAVRGASLELLIQILAKQVFLAVLLGSRTIAGRSFDSGPGLAIAILAVTAGIAIEIYVLLRAPLAWKAFIVFSICILGVSLAYPMTASPQWPAMLGSGGVRYWYFSLLAFVASIVWMLQCRNSTVVRGAAMALLALMLYGIVQDFGHPRPADLHFAVYAKAFEGQPSGSTFVIPINPDGWTVELMKH
jgi:hypothetical protein